MISSDNTKIHREWKIVKKMDIDKKLKSELEDILEKQLSEPFGNNQKDYPAERKSIFRKQKKK